VITINSKRIKHIQMCCGRKNKKKGVYDPDLPVLHAEVLPSRQIPIFKGRMLLGPDRITYAITFILLGLPAIFYLAFTCVDLFRYVHWTAGVLLTIAGLALFSANIYCLIRVGTMDPGVIPKNLECYREFFFASDTQNNDETSKSK
jgi:hypothetical protein